MKKTEQILGMLREEFYSGKYRKGERFSSEQKLMERFDVSRITVNKITEQLVADGFLIRGRQGAGTRILDCNPFPRGQIAYLGPVEHPYFAAMTTGILQTAFYLDYAVNLFSPKKNQVNIYLNRVEHSKCLGLLVADVGTLPENFQLPVVYLDSGVPDDNVPRCSITCSNYKGAAAIAEALCKRGHRNILISTSLEQVEYSRTLRIRGFTDTLEKFGVTDVKKRIFTNIIHDVIEAKKVLRDMLRDFPGVTAVLTDSDDLAFSFLCAAKELNLEEGRITFTGFGNIPWISGYFHLPTVEQHPYHIGSQGVSELLKWIGNSHSFQKKNIEIETELVGIDKIPFI